MVGIIGGGLASSVTLDAMGLDAIPSPAGDVASSSVGEGFSSSIGPRLFRQTEAMAGRSDFAPEDAFGVQSDTGPMLEPAEAQDRFGLPGLTFSAPISQGAAQALYDAKRAEAVRQDTINRRPTGLLTGQAAQLAYGFIGGMMDPLNLAAGLVPGVGEARVLGMLGEGVAARVGARAIAGATAGAAGMAALEPLNYALDQAEGQDWSMSQALRNIAFGGVLGGGLHVVGGAIAGRGAPGAEASAAAAPPPPVADGFTRFYHGGGSLEAGPRWVSPDLEYARGYADKGRAGRVWYVDLPNDHPDLVKAFDDTGSSAAAPWLHFEASADVASGLREFERSGVKAQPGATRRNPVTERIDTLDPAARETVLRGAVAQHVEGEPVRVADALDTAETARYAEVGRRDPALSEWLQVRDDAEMRLADRQAELDQFHVAREARNRGEAPDFLASYSTPAAVDAAIRGREMGAAALQGRLAIAEHAIETLRAGDEPGFRARYDDPELNRPAGVDAPGAMPQTLLSRIRELGGLQDSGGELAARDLDKTPGMVRHGGMSLERAAVRLSEEGYLPELSRDMAGAGPEQVDRIGALLDAIDEQRSGRPRLREEDVPVWDEMMSRHEAALNNLQAAAEHFGITEREARGLSRGQVQDVLARRVEAGPDAFDLPGWEDLPPARTVPELQRDMGAAMDRMRSPPDDPVGQADERLIRETTDRAPKVEAATPDRRLAEAQAAADAVVARVQVEAKAGRLPEDALARLDEAAKMAEGDARAHEAAAACFATRGL